MHIAHRLLALSLLLVGAAILFTCPRAIAADTFGLVIGIDDYQHINKLQGAVNDARDIADALRTAGARDVRTLLDREATRDRVLTTWRELIGRARPGDVLVVSYAGHGAQEPERVAGSEEDHLDEVVLLAGFDPDGAESYERIPDDDINQLLKESGQLNVLFVADACHSGTMTRSFGPTAARPTVRYYEYGAIEDDHLPPPRPTAAAIRESDLKHVVFLAGVTDDRVVPEVRIGREKRGALSWSVAQALRGEADADRDGVLTKGELETFVLENVRMKTSGQQYPVVSPSGQEQRPLLRTSAATASVPPEEGPRYWPLESVPVRAGGLAEADRVNLPSRLDRLELVLDADDADLVWDAGSGSLTRAGEMVARLEPAGGAETRAARRALSGSAPALSAIDLPRLQGVIDTWGLHDRLVAAGESRSLVMRLQPDDRRHRQGDRVTLIASGIHHPYFTLINLTSTGEVNFLYPLTGQGFQDSATVTLDRPFPLELEIEPPFGADHFVAIASATPLPALHRDLAALSGRPAAAGLARSLDSHLRGVVYQLGVHLVFTGDP